MLTTNATAKREVELEIVNIMREKEYTLNTVNNYAENLLHISAANGCLEITKEILKKEKNCSAINRKNMFGWTPLMQAIRNGDIKTTKFLLDRGSNVNESTYLGMSTIGLAAAISKEMFEIVYKACPSALKKAANDDINPICVAAMKNDKELFFRLLDLGINITEANEYTRFMMRQSSVPEINSFAKFDLSNEDYWNDDSDNIKRKDEINEQCYGKHNYEVETSDTNVHMDDDSVTNQRCPIIISDCDVGDKNKLKPLQKQNNFSSNFLSCQASLHQLSIISPTLSYNKEENFPASPQTNYNNDNSSPFPCTSNESVFNFKTESVSKPSMENSTCPSSKVLQRLQSIRPPDLQITPEELDTTLVGFVPEFSPVKSAEVPPDINDDNVFGENTPTPPHYHTPPRGMILNTQQDKMVLILQRFGLSQHVPIFLEQEVDMDLFMTLTEDDLMEIGIRHEQDRRQVIAIIEECKKTDLY